ncbi:MAG: DNA replication/repair protein RecF [Thermoleophilia bacterium]
MYLRRLNLRNFRNIRRAAIELPPGISIIIGENGAGKTSLLEAVQYATCGRSFRTSREQEMVGDDHSYFRIEADLEWNATSLSRSVAYEQGSGAKVDPGGGPQWLPPGSVLCFSPDDLQLIKGSPSLRRRFLDEAISRRLPAYHRTLIDHQKVLSQRNSFLQRARAGLVQLADISPWDRQLAALAVRISDARREHSQRITPYFQETFRQISGEESDAVVWHVSQLESQGNRQEREERLVALLAARWSEDLERLATGLGAHRDDIEFRLDGRSLKPYGSQGEQRAAVLALLLADRQLGGETGQPPLLLLDDVMSELDPERRRRLLAALAPEEGEIDNANFAQTLITVADPGLFSASELSAAFVLKVGGGATIETGLG